MSKLAWHFVRDTLKDGRPVPPDGEWLEHDDELVMCESGLHSSYRANDALIYAPGSIICRVEIDGETIEHADKNVSRRRRILWRVNGEALLVAFSRWCALQVIDIWDAPEVVRLYLKTGDETSKTAARVAARAASRWEEVRDAAWTAARAAARSAAWAAARDTALDAARAAAKDATRAAARDVARNAARGAARDASWDAAWAAAKAADRDADRAMAWDAAWDAQNAQLETMIEEARNGRTEWVWD